MRVRSGCMGFYSFETLLLVVIASGILRDGKSTGWREHMAITSSGVVGIWVITTLTVHLLSHRAEGLLSLSPPFILCLSTCSSLCLGCSLPNLSPPLADKLLQGHLSGQLFPLPSRISHAPSETPEHPLSLLQEALSIIVGLLVFFLLSSLRPGAGSHPSVSLSAEPYRLSA